MLTIDGSIGEGGGQILRTALALSAVTRTPFRIEHIRAARARPGLLRQHLAAVKAAAEICGAAVEGAALGSATLTFRPNAIRAGEFAFTVGTAGSTTLVLQTVLPALIVAPAPSRLMLEGGTHNPAAPPFDFLAKSFLPLINRMGAKVAAELQRPGFYPAGGGRFAVEITPAAELKGLELMDRGAIRALRARALVVNLPLSIAERELKVVRRMLPISRDDAVAQEIRGGPGPGNAVMVEVETASHTEVFTGFGARGVRAETVAETAARQALAYLESGVPVGPHLADQLLVPLALARQGRFRTGPPTLHTTTNVEVIRRFVEVGIELQEESPGVWTVTISGSK
jgi:RNA 3'-terminal phosphate cyclase (ATP)